MNRLVVGLAPVLLLMGGMAVVSTAESPVSLLRLDSVKTSLKPSANARQWKSLVDGNARTVARLAATGRESTIVLKFGQVVSPSEVRLTLPKGSGLQQVQLLISPEATGNQFRLVRADFIDAQRTQHTFKIPPSSGRQLMVRLRGADEPATIDIADLHVAGTVGEVASRYLFKESPASALRVLEQLRGFSDSLVSKDEQSLAQDAADGRLDDWTVAEAALLASGVTAKTKRAAYLKKIARWERDLRRLKGQTVMNTGDELLRWLHRGPLKGGYQAQQTRLSTIIDTGKFNCVSSAALYSILGRRLGWDVRGIEVPDHAFAIVYDGNRHADVETTNAAGFNPLRDAAARRAFESQTGFRYIPDRHRDKRREVTPTGLAALIYYNRGVGHVKKKQFEQALHCNFMSLSLDRESASAVKNALVALSNWSVELARTGKYQQAVDVVAVGLRLAPEDKGLQRHQVGAWSQYAVHLIDRGAERDALTVLRKAHQATESAHFQKMQSWVFMNPAQKAAKKGQWDEAEKISRRGLKLLSGDPQRALTKWFGSLLLGRNSHHIKAREFDSSLTALDAFAKQFPKDRRLDRAAAFLAQEWAEHLAKVKTPYASLERLQKMRSHFANASVARSSQAFVARQVTALAKKGEFEQAWMFTEGAAELFRDFPRELKSVQRSIVDRESGHHEAKGDFEQAVAAYQRGLQRLPADSHLLKNLVFLWDERARKAMKKGDFEAAAATYEQALKALPKQSRLANNVRFLAQEWAGKLAEKEGELAAESKLRELLQRFKTVPKLPEIAQSHIVRQARGQFAQRDLAKTLAAIDRGCDLIKQKRVADQLSRMAYDHWADIAVANKDFAKATALYRQGMTRYPQNKGIRTNARATWSKWARTQTDRKEWPQAIAIYRRALQAFPGDRLFENNLGWCEQTQKEATAQD